MNRVVITGAGTVNALAQDLHGTYAAMAEGRSGIARLSFRDSDRLTVGIGAQVKNWEEASRFSRQDLALFDRFTQFAMVAAQEAVEQSGLGFASDLALQSGVILGTAGGGLTTTDDNYRAVYAEGKNRVHPFVVPRLMNNAAASHISIKFGLKGAGFSIASACASSNHAMSLAFQMIRGGGAKVMLTGGSEAMLCFGGLKAWEGLRVMSNDACRPFSLNRTGLVQGEGAAVFVFEDYQHACARGAEILAEVIGASMTMDASDIVMPDGDGAKRAMLLALQDAQISPEKIGYVNAHGTGTAANDRVECEALHAVFGAHTQNLMVSSTKSMHGHAIGATGAIELIACLMALQKGIIAPTVGFQQADPDCNINAVPNEAREADVDVVLSNAFAFGGMNSVIALKRI